MNGHPITRANNHGGNTFHTRIGRCIHSRQGINLVVEGCTIWRFILEVSLLTTSDEVVLVTGLDLWMQRSQGLKNLLLLFSRQITTPDITFLTFLSHQFVHTFLVGIGQDDPLHLSQHTKGTDSSTDGRMNGRLDSSIHWIDDQVKHVVGKHLEGFPINRVLGRDFNLLCFRTRNRIRHKALLLGAYSNPSSQSLHSLIQLSQLLSSLGIVREHSFSSRQSAVISLCQQSIRDPGIQVIQHGVG